MEESDEIIDYIGFMKLTGNDGSQRVYFNSEDENDYIDSGLLHFVIKDGKDNKISQLLVNPNEGHIRSIEYWEEK